ncbi:hypothetical protein [Xanthomonas arboricola]|uniref:hypothetical protein n=1 Tax=Xanthomonas arboricola TaxID=56448 RepID=UPI000CEEE895|nr:hypothetical protein [Xanthomonas arboricola]PPU42768.1 hypothetical protein XaplCFBP3123_06280 [Xanthomonas arboricola pv. populi]
MSTAPFTPASVPGYLLPASAHGLLWDVGEVLRRLAARTAAKQASDRPAHPLSRQLTVSPHTSCRWFARRAVALQQCVAATITGHHPEAP